MAYEIPKFAESVAAVLGCSLGDYFDAELLSLPIYDVLPELEKKIPGISDMPEDDPKRAAADKAIICATAAKLVPFYRQQVMKREQVPGATVERYDIDWSQFTAELQGNVDSALGEVSPEYAKDSGSSFIGFQLSGGRRNIYYRRCC